MAVSVGQQHQSIPFSFPFLSQSQQGDKTCLQLLLMFCDEMLQVPIIASWSICCGFVSDGWLVLCCSLATVGKGQNKEKGLDKREDSQWDPGSQLCLRYLLQTEMNCLMRLSNTWTRASFRNSTSALLYILLCFFFHGGISAFSLASLAINKGGCL